MPISSASRQQAAKVSAIRNKRSRHYWPANSIGHPTGPNSSSADSKSIGSNSEQRGAPATKSLASQVPIKYKHIRNFKGLTASSKEAREDSDVESKDIRQHKAAAAAAAMQPTSMSIGGHQLILGSPSGSGGKQPVSIGSITVDGGDSKKNGANYLASNSSFQSHAHNSQSRSSLHQTPINSTTNSTAHLHSLSNLTGTNQSRPLSIRRNVNLKYIKTLIIMLMAVDLLITVCVHQFSSQDKITIWFTSYKLRFSLLNLVLSAVWFITLIGAILFDILFILIIACLVNLSSLILLFALSVVHFTRRIDYNSVNLTSFLALLFGIIVLHVYMIVMTGLNIYLTMAVKRRRTSSSSR